MDLKDIVLVSERDKKDIVHYLATVKDYILYMQGAYWNDRVTFALIMEEMVEIKGQADIWSEKRLDPSTRLYTKFCESASQLHGFVAGIYPEEYVCDRTYHFDLSRCSPECLDMMKTYNLRPDGGMLSDYHDYEQLPHTFHAGETIQNMNHSDYFVLEVLSNQNLLLWPIGTNEIMIGVGSRYYSRVPRDVEIPSGEKQYGVVWEHGVYLGGGLTSQDFDEIREKYSTPENKKELGVYRNNLKRAFILCEKMLKNEVVSDEVKLVVEDDMRTVFRTADKKTFLGELYNGRYDNQFFEQRQNATASAPPKAKSR